MKIELTKQEIYTILMALDTEAENNLRLIGKDCDFDVQSSEVYVNSYLKNLNLIKKLNKELEEK